VKILTLRGIDLRGPISWLEDLQITQVIQQLNEAIGPFRISRGRTS